MFIATPSVEEIKLQRSGMLSFSIHGLFRDLKATSGDFDDFSGHAVPDGACGVLRLVFIHMAVLTDLV